MRYLDFRSHLFDVNEQTKKAVAAAVADIQPDIALMLWRNDHHDDHVVASQLSGIALRYASPILDKRDVKGPSRIYHVRQRSAAHDRLRAGHVCRYQRPLAAGHRVAGTLHGPGPQRAVSIPASWMGPSR